MVSPFELPDRSQKLKNDCLLLTPSWSKKIRYWIRLKSQLNQSSIVANRAVLSVFFQSSPSSIAVFQEFQLSELALKLLDLSLPSFFLARVVLGIDLELGRHFVDLLPDRLVFLLDELEILLRQVCVAVALELAQAVRLAMLNRNI